MNMGLSRFKDAWPFSPNRRLTHHTKSTVNCEHTKGLVAYHRTLRGLRLICARKSVSVSIYVEPNVDQEN